MKTLLVTLSVISLTFALDATAATLQMVNHTGSKVEVVIEPGKGMVLPNPTEIRQVLAPGEEKMLTINKEALNNTSIFSIMGKDNMISLYNKCESLSMDKNYKIVFVSGKFKDIICTCKQVE